MSGILRNKFFQMFCLLSYLFGIWVLIYLRSKVILLVWLLGGLACLINLYVYKMIKTNVHQLNANGIIRNVDYLIIGEQYDYKELIPEQASSFVVLSPKRSLTASFEILKHTFSILKDKGTVIILDKGFRGDEYTVFDIPYFHPVTIRRLKLDKLKKVSIIPLLVSPISTLKMVFPLHRNAGICEELCPMKEIVNFCIERDIQLTYLKMK